MEVAQIDFSQAKPEDFQLLDGTVAPTAAPAAPETPAAPAVAPVTEPPVTTPVTTPSATPEATTPAPATTATKLPDWKESLRAQGFDDHFLKVADFYKEKGSLLEYLKVKSADYKTMDTVSLLRMQHDEQYASLTPEEREVLWEVDVVDKYALDRTAYAETDKAAQSGLIRLKMEADKIRAAKIQQQESFGEPNMQHPVEQGASETIEQMNASPEMTSFLQSKTLPFLLNGKPVFNLRVDDPGSVSNLFVDDNAFADAAFDENGAPNVQRMLLAGAVLKNPELVIKGIFEAGVSAGRNNQYEVTEDAQPFSPTPASASGEPSDFIQAFKANGKLVNE